MNAPSLLDIFFPQINFIRPLEIVFNIGNATLLESLKLKYIIIIFKFIDTFII